MHVATLIANPAEPVLTVGNVLPYHRALGGGEFRWLQDGVACEFPLETVPDDWRQVWRSLQDRGVDLAIQKSEGRRKQMLLADMDSTMIQQECIDELADEAGFGERVAAITRRAMNGELVFEAALRERVALLAGLPETVIDRVLENRLTPMPGGPVLLATMTGAGAYAALVSGGFTVFTEAVAEALGFDENRANTLEIVDGVLTGRVIEPILGREAKVEALRQISAARGLGLDQVMAVGDGANDLGMLKLAGSGVALHAKPAVAAECELRINFGDLTALLFLQGYSREEFRTPTELRLV